MLGSYELSNEPLGVVKCGNESLGTVKCGNKPLGTVKCGEFHDCLNYCQLRKKDCAPCR